MLLQCLSGSRAYGLHTENSDTDVKGVFYVPENIYFGTHTIDQVANPGNDLVYYELKRFVELLYKNNPNILELLFSPKECIMFRHPLMDLIKPEWVLSRLCEQTFAGYAHSQIKKAYGLNKKILNPMEKERKSVLDFCYVLTKGKTIQLNEWLKTNKMNQQDCGLVAMDHAKNTYGLYIGEPGSDTYRGIISGEDTNEVSLSSVEKGIMPEAYMVFNKEGYSTYCKRYREYWEWVNDRNEHRYAKTMEHGKNYDSKNMMHTFRLLHMAREIALEGIVHVHRKDRDFLWRIRNGEFEYSELTLMAEDLLNEIKLAYQKTSLPEEPDKNMLEKTLYYIRKELYHHA